MLILFNQSGQIVELDIANAHEYYLRSETMTIP